MLRMKEFKRRSLKLNRFRMRKDCFSSDKALNRLVFHFEKLLNWS